MGNEKFNEELTDPQGTKKLAIQQAKIRSEARTLLTKIESKEEVPFQTFLDFFNSIQGVFDSLNHNEALKNQFAEAFIPRCNYSRGRTNY
ncbi:MAG: hypothetical protein mread185_000650 [Mycoplasmataceae bacterium]|nr:MAG: hypothetical protein mread185_000650 [Mycoplasmataceae bacterium]